MTTHINLRGAEIVQGEIREGIADGKHGYYITRARLESWLRLLEGREHAPDPAQTSLPLSLPEKARARSTDPQTSHEAAASIRPTQSHLAVMRALCRRYSALHDEQIRAIIGHEKISASRVRTALVELRRAGLAANSSLTLERRGREVNGWLATAEGVVWLAVNDRRGEE